MAIKRYIQVPLVIAILISSLIWESSAQCTGQNIGYGTFDGAGYSGYNNATLNQPAPPLTDIPNNGICWDDASTATLNGSACSAGGFTIANSDDYYEDWDVANSFSSHSGNMMIVNLDGTIGTYTVLSNSYTGCSLANTYTLSVDYAMLNAWNVSTRSATLQYSSDGSTWSTCGTADMHDKCKNCGSPNPGWQTLSCVIPSTSNIFIRVQLAKSGGADDKKNDWAFDNFSLIGVFPSPVEFIAFNGKPSGDGGTFLTWVTGSEINSSHFEVQRSDDGINWSVIGVVNSKNMSSGAQYEFYDTEANNIELYYRLKEVDFDNSSIISKTVSSSSGDKNSFLEIIPNVADHEDQVKVTFSKDMSSVVMYDQLGRSILSGNINEDRQYMLVDCAFMSPGLYIVKGIIKDGGIITKKLIIK